MVEEEEEGMNDGALGSWLWALGVEYIHRDKGD